MSKQTAVEWLLGQISLNGFQAKHIQQAKSMEKQQIIDAYNNARATGYGEAKEYYNETFNK